MKNILIHSSAYALSILAAYLFLIRLFPELGTDQFYIYLLILATLNAGTAFAHLKLNSGNNPEKFVQLFLVSTGVKFIFSLFAILIITVIYPNDKQLLALTYLSVYLVYMILESVNLIRNLGHSK